MIASLCDSGELCKEVVKGVVQPSPCLHGAGRDCGSISLEFAVGGRLGGKAVLSSRGCVVSLCSGVCYDGVKPENCVGEGEPCYNIHACLLWGGAIGDGLASGFL